MPIPLSNCACFLWSWRSSNRLTSLSVLIWWGKGEAWVLFVYVLMRLSERDEPLRIVNCGGFAWEAMFTLSYSDPCVEVLNPVVNNSVLWLQLCGVVWNSSRLISSESEWWLLLMLQCVSHLFLGIEGDLIRRSVEKLIHLPTAVLLVFTYP